MITNIIEGCTIDAIGHTPSVGNKHLHPERFNEMQVSEVKYVGTGIINGGLVSQENWIMGTRS
jgi:hypothetical protein